jgi:hypothetical protein
MGRQGIEGVKGTDYAIKFADLRIDNGRAGLCTRSGPAIFAY